MTALSASPFVKPIEIRDSVGGFVGFCLAMLNRAEPTDTEATEWLKECLGQVPMLS